MLTGSWGVWGWGGLGYYWRGGGGELGAKELGVGGGVGELGTWGAVGSWRVVSWGAWEVRNWSWENRVGSWELGNWG